jgi:hypothetical protein
VRSTAAELSNHILLALGAVIAAFWVAICAAAPEFIWQGLWIAAAHVTLTEVLSALLVGLVLAFFVEPLMERLRGERHRGSRHGPGAALFTAALSLAFALASIGLHEAMTAFVAERAAGHEGGLEVAIALTMAWAFVPFAVTVAWLSVPIRWLAVPLGAVAVLAPIIAGWLFGWQIRSVLTTTIPSVLILALGYRQPIRSGLTPRANTVAWVSAIWLAAALLVDLILGLVQSGPFRLYGAFSFWVDARFYAGWTIGLALAPSPYRPHGDTS